jgi:sigma-B regulation protein RsbU (phosphoserine phosphatase)
VTVLPRQLGALGHIPDPLESEALLRETLTRVRRELAVDVVTVLRLDPGSRHLVTVLTESEDRVAPVHHRVPVGRGLAGRVAHACVPIALKKMQDDDLVNPALLALGVRSVLGLPVFHDHRLTAVLKVGTVETRRFTPQQVAQAETLADEVSAALEEYFAADERAAAAALQRSLVPTRLPSIDGLDLSGRYIPGQGGVSGDWYDVFALPGGRVGMVMGDVAGHGLPASVVMGRLRSALRAYSLEYDDPAEVLAHLDQKIVHFEPGAMATAVYAVAAPPFDRIQVASAGHFVPIRVPTEGVPHPAEVPVGLPLGVDPGLERVSGPVDLDPGHALLLFTDGLVERRTHSTPRSEAVFESIDTALDTLIALLAPGDADEIASRVLDTMLTIEPPSDDVAVLVVRRSSS